MRMELVNERLSLTVAAVSGVLEADSDTGGGAWLFTFDDIVVLVVLS